MYINNVFIHISGFTHRALFLLTFHWFFRISNLLPTSQSTFQPLRDLARGDVTISSPGLLVLLKWTKTLQASRDQHLIPLTAVPGSVLCPLQAVIQLNSQYPVPNTAPMFSHMVSDRLVVITHEKACKVLSTALSAMGLDPLDYGFDGPDTFRCSGASLAFSLNIPVQFIKAQGTWQSDAIYRYIDQASYPTILTTTISQFLANTT